MNRWKIGFFLVTIIGIMIMGFQQFTIFELGMEIDRYTSLIPRIDNDLESMRVSFLKKYKKDDFLSQLQKNDPALKTFEYDLGNVKMRGIDVGFDKDNRLRSLSTQTY